MMVPEKKFAGFSVMTVADLLQRPPVRRKLIFSQFSNKGSMKNLLGLQLWHLFKCKKLTEVVRLNNKLFIDLLNKVRVGKINNDVAKLLKARFKHESEEKYSKKDALNMYVENEHTMKRNYVFLNDLPGVSFTQ